MSKKIRMDNVFMASCGYYESYSNSKYRYPKKIEKELSYYTENNLLKTDLESLSRIAEILDNWTGEMVVINKDKTITFYDGNY